MPKLSKEKQEEIIRALEERGAKLPCPRCGNPDFALVDGYLTPVIQSELGSMTLGGPSVPSIVTACKKCGYLSQHALGALGLLPEKEAEDG